MKKFFSKIAQRAFALAISTMVVTNTFAQGAAGIDAASSELATYMDPLGNMMMILGGLVGLVGAVRVYLKWNSGDQDVQKAVMGWMGSCIFLVVSGCCRKSILRNLICRKSIQVTMCIRGCKSPLFSKDLKASSYISVELVLLVLYFYVLLFLLWLLLCGEV